MECAQIQITGGGSKQPATVSFPGAYKGTDPGIKINIYSPLTSYTIPGASLCVLPLFCVCTELGRRACGVHVLSGREMEGRRAAGHFWISVFAYHTIRISPMIKHEYCNPKS